MSPLVPPTRVGLAAAGLTAVMMCFPTLAYADSGTSVAPPPAPEATATATSGASPSSNSSSSSSTTPSAEPPSSPVPSSESTPGSSPEPSAAEPREPDPLPVPADENEAENKAEAQGDSGRADDSRQVNEPQDAVLAPQAEAAAEQQAEAEADSPGQADISLTKTASPARVSKVGQVITYRFVATNIGSIELTDVAIIDELEGLSSLSCDQSTASATLAPGEALNCSATLTVTQAVLDFGDLDNFATVFGEYDLEGQADYVGANAAAHVTVAQQPSIALNASVSPSGKADRGDRLRYTATATNTGNVTLTAARITSNLNALELSCEPTARATLAPGASISCAGSYRVSSADARQGRVSAIVTARAEQPYGESSDSGDDVIDSSTLRVAVTKPASTRNDDSAENSQSTDSGLADTGSSEGSLPIGLLGVLMAVSGIGLIRRGRRD